MNVAISTFLIIIASPEIFRKQVTAFLSPSVAVESIAENLGRNSFVEHKSSPSNVLFASDSSHDFAITTSTTPTPTTDRRGILDIGIKGATFFLASSEIIEPALASGGATAGGAYLLSAKQRYNKRVTSGVQNFLNLDPRDLRQVEIFFTSTEEGGWDDLSSAGYLLANAFRTSSTKAPDNLPSVKKWKSFCKDIDLIQKALSKKDSDKIFSAFKSAEEKLDAYLEAVELPSGIELKQL